jgi:hypothetical protein
VLLVGGANGRLKGNRHIALDKEKKEPTANLLVALGDLAGADVSSVSDRSARF